MSNGDKLCTVVIGFGKAGSGYAEDPLMARYYPYATHAQALSDHPAFSWDAVVDPSEGALEAARSRWNVRLAVKTIEELPDNFSPDVAVIATPPESRTSIIERLPSVRAVLVEKPLGTSLAESKKFLDLCAGRGVLVQVNYWRRADELFRRLAGGYLGEIAGRPQAVFALYGNGLLNNGNHIIDFIRMLFGDAGSVRALGSAEPAGPIQGDVNIPFSLKLKSGLPAVVQPLDFTHYRENGLDIWGERARLSILISGLGVFLYPCRANRAMRGEMEIATDMPDRLISTVGRALYRMYDNLAEAVNSGGPLWSPGDSALKTAETLHAVLESASKDGARVEIAG